MPCPSPFGRKGWVVGAYADDAALTSPPAHWIRLERPRDPLDWTLEVVDKVTRASLFLHLADVADFLARAGVDTSVPLPYQLKE